LSAKNSGESFAEKDSDKALVGSNKTHKPSRIGGVYFAIAECKMQTNAKTALAAASRFHRTSAAIIPLTAMCRTSTGTATIGRPT